MYPGYASSSAQLTCHRGRGTAAAGIDEGVPDLTPARLQIQLVMIGAEVGDLDLAYTIIEAILLPLAELLLMNRRGSDSSEGSESYERVCSSRVEIDESSNGGYTMPHYAEHCSLPPTTSRARTKSVQFIQGHPGHQASYLQRGRRTAPSG